MKLQSLLEMNGQDPDWVQVFFSKEAYQDIRYSWEIRDVYFTPNKEVAGSVKSYYWPKLKQELDRKGLEYRTSEDKQPQQAQPFPTHTAKIWFAHWVQRHISTIMSKFPHIKKTEDRNQLIFYVPIDDWDRLVRFLTQTLNLHFGKDFGKV